MRMLFASITLLLIAMPAVATIYKCRQADGTYLYSDKECPASSSENTIIGKKTGPEPDPNGHSPPHQSATPTPPVETSHPLQPVKTSASSDLNSNQLLGNWKCTSDALDIELDYEFKQGAFLRSADVMGMQFKAGGNWQLNGDQLVLTTQWEQDHKGRRDDSTTQSLTIAELTASKLHMHTKDSLGDTVNTRCTK